MKILSGFTKGLLFIAVLAAGFTLYDYTLGGGGGDLYEVGFVGIVLVLAAASHFIGRPSNFNKRP